MMRSKNQFAPEGTIEALADVRTRFRAAVVVPVHRAMQARYALDSALQFIHLPMEAAAAGFDVHVSQHRDGWSITIERQVDAETVFHASARAKSLRAAMFQVSDRGLQWLSYEESNARTAAAKAVKELETAA